MSYGFDNKEDSSENNRDIKETKNADIDGALKLKGGESYASTPIEKLAVGNALSFDVTLTEEARAGQILFEADTPAEKIMYMISASWMTEELDSEESFMITTSIINFRLARKFIWKS